MADIKINSLQEINSTLLKIKDDIGSSRTDIFFFLFSDITVEDLEEKAFKKSLLLNINKENNILYSFPLSKLLL